MPLTGKRCKLGFRNRKTEFIPFARPWTVAGRKLSFRIVVLLIAAAVVLISSGGKAYARAAAIQGLPALLAVATSLIAAN